MSLLRYLPLIIRAGFSKNVPVAVSANVTDRCNLRCEHCYKRREEEAGIEPKSDLSTEDYLRLLRDLKKEYPIVHATWIGGEPLLRKDLVERGMKLFPFNMIITNGTVSLPDWENCCFNVSVDGTKEYHAKVRGNNYDLIKRNIARSKSKVNLICVLSRLNADCIEDMVEEWSQTRVRGIVFDFYTPGKQDSNQICLTPSERDEVLERIKKLKLKYDNFIIPSFDLLNLMESQNARKVTSHCRMQRDVISLDASGNRILPCVMGKDADCSRCGCMIPFTRFDTPLSKKPQRYMDLLKMYSQYL